MVEIHRLQHTMHKDYKIIALDLDGTLLNSKKQLTDINKDALKKASSLGIEIVPCTGRFYNLMPESIKSLDFVNYAITINGAQICNVKTGEVIYDASMKLETALKLMEHLDTLPCIYDCYMNSAAWMSRVLYEHIDDYPLSEHYNKMWKTGRTPVDDLKTYIKEMGNPIQKIQFLFKDAGKKPEYIETLKGMFPTLNISSSMDVNIEINDIHANKGIAINKLAEYIGCQVDQTVAIGDGLNDYDMIKAAGLGIAMKNSCDEILALAKEITDDCDHDGVAKAIEKYILNKRMTD